MNSIKSCWGCTFGGIYLPCVYLHARPSYCRWFGSLLCPYLLSAITPLCLLTLHRHSRPHSALDYYQTNHLQPSQRLHKEIPYTWHAVEPLTKDHPDDKPLLFSGHFKNFFFFLNFPFHISILNPWPRTSPLWFYFKGGPERGLPLYIWIISSSSLTHSLPLWDDVLRKVIPACLEDIVWFLASIPTCDALQNGAKVSKRAMPFSFRQLPGTQRT